MSAELVYPAKKVRNRQYYEAARLTRAAPDPGKSPEVTVDVGDIVWVHSGNVNDPFIGMVTEFFDDPTGSYMTVRWLYKGNEIPPHIRKIKKISEEEVQFQRSQNDEALLSNCEDTNSLLSLKDIASMEIRGKDRTVPSKPAHCVIGPSFVCKRLYFPRKVHVRGLSVSEIEKSNKIKLGNWKDDNSHVVVGTSAGSQADNNPATKEKKPKQDSQESGISSAKPSHTGPTSDRIPQKETPASPSKKALAKPERTSASTNGTLKQEGPPTSTRRTGDKTESEKVESDSEDSLPTTRNMASAKTPTTRPTASGNQKRTDQRKKRQSAPLPNRKRHKHRKTLISPPARENSNGEKRMSLIEMFNEWRCSADIGEAYAYVVPSERPQGGLCFDEEPTTKVTTINNGNEHSNVNVNSGGLPLRRDILTKNTGQRTHLQLPADYNSVRPMSRIGDKFQASLPSYGEPTAGELITDSVCTWKPPRGIMSRENVDTFVTSVSQIIHFVHVGVRVGAYHHSRQRYFPGVIVAVRLPPSSIEKTQGTGDRDHPFAPGAVVDVLFDHSNNCKRFDARYVILSDAFKTITEETALEILMSQDYDSGVAQDEVRKLHRSFISQKSFLPTLDGSGGPTPATFLPYRPPEVRDPYSKKNLEDAFNTLQSYDSYEADSDSVESSRPEDCDTESNTEGSGSSLMEHQEVTQRLLLRGLLSLPPGWSTEEKHMFSIGYNRFGKSFRRIHALMKESLEWRLPSVSFGDELNMATLPGNVYHLPGKLKSVRDLIWFYYTTKHQRRFVDGPFWGTGNSDDTPKPSEYVKCLRGNSSSALEHALSPSTPRSMTDGNDRRNVASYTSLSGAAVPRGYSGMVRGSDYSIRSMDSKLLPTSSVRICTNPRCTSRRLCAVDEHNFRTYIASLRTCGRPSWERALRTPWWYCFDCCPVFPSSSELQIEREHAAYDDAMRRVERNTPDIEQKNTNSNGQEGSAEAFLEQLQKDLEFNRSPGRFKKLLSCLERFRSGELSAREVAKRVCKLLSGCSPNMFHSFKNFVPAHAHDVVDNAISSLNGS